MSLRTTLLSAASAVLFSAALATDAMAQQASNALGLRIDNPISFQIGGGRGSDYYALPHLSYKRYLTERDAVEVALGYRRIRYRTDDLTSTTVSSQISYQRYVAFGEKTADAPAPLRWYYGGGLGVSSTKLPFTVETIAGELEYDNKSTTYSAFGLIGIVYQPPRVPVEFSLDTGPAFEHVVDGSNSRDLVFGSDDGASSSYLTSTSFSLGARWTFGGNGATPQDAD